VISGHSEGDFSDIRVKDSGIGIDENDQTIIFEKFFSLGPVGLHSSSKNKFKGGGPGLGLAIARGIVEAHHGKIWAESAGHDEIRLHGSTFIVRLPVVKPAQTEASPDQYNSQLPEPSAMAYALDSA
jgi:signal transduction histidine kinase